MKMAENENKTEQDSKEETQHDLPKTNGKIDTTMDDSVELTSNVRILSGWVRYVFMAIAVIGALYHLYILNFHPIDPWVFRSTHLVFGTVLGLMLYPGWRSKSNKVHIVDWILIIITIFVGYYIYANLVQLVFRFGVTPTNLDFYVAFAGLLLVLEFIRRNSG